jgi:hypothetical protein
VENEKIYTVEEAADVLGICTESVRLNLRSGALTGFRIGDHGSWKIKGTDLFLFIEENYERCTDKQREFLEKNRFKGVVQEVLKQFPNHAPILFFPCAERSLPELLVEALREKFGVEAAISPVREGRGFAVLIDGENWVKFLNILYGDKHA